MSRNACENRRNGNDFHSGHQKQNLNLQTLQLRFVAPIIHYYISRWNRLSAKLVGWEQLATQDVCRRQVHKRVAGAASAGGAKRPVDVCSAPTETEWRRCSVPCEDWEPITNQRKILRCPQDAPSRAQRTTSCGV